MKYFFTNENYKYNFRMNKIGVLIAFMTLFLCISSISYAYTSQKIVVHCHGKTYTYSGGGGGNTMSTPLETCDPSPWVEVWGADYDTCWCTPQNPNSEFWTNWNYQDEDKGYTYGPDIGNDPYRRWEVGWKWRPSCNHDHYQDEEPKSEWLYVYLKRVDHKYGDWSTNTTKHWKNCSMCGVKASEGNHRDTNSDGYCDDCHYLMKRFVNLPTANTGLIYNGNSQVGVATGTGYTVTSGSATDAGSYTAKVKPTTGYWWSDNHNSQAERSITWSIAKKSVEVTWGTTTTFECDQENHAPTASASSGVAGETINLSVANKQKYLGNYTATASIGSVSGGRAKAGNYTLTNTTKAYTIVDTIKPTITSSRNYNGWTNTDVTVSLSGKDRNGSKNGSGIQSIQTSDNGTSGWTNVKTDADNSHIDMDATKTYTTNNNTVLNHTYYYKAIDRANNQSDNTSQLIRIDKVLPIISITRNPTQTNDFINGNISFTITFSDANSGVAKLDYKIGNNAWTQTNLKTTSETSHTGNFAKDANGTGPTSSQTLKITFNSDLDSNITFRVTDVAGNTNTVTSTIKIDKTLPNIVVTKENVKRTGAEDGIDDWTTGKVKFTITCTDATSGVRNIYYKRNVDTDWIRINATEYARASAASKNVTVTQEFTAEQNTTVQFRVDDWVTLGTVAPLTKLSNTFNIRIDNTLPTVNITHDTTWTNQDVLVNVDAKDLAGGAQSGVVTTAGMLKWNNRNITDVSIISKIDNSTFTNIIGKIYQDKNITNGAVYVRDKAGNVATTTITHTITNIDKIPPTITLTSAGDERYQSFTITDPAATADYGQSLLYGFAGVDNATTVPSQDYEGTSWIGTIRNDYWYRMPNNESANPKQTSTANIQYFFPSSGTYYVKVRDIAGNITPITVTITLRKIQTDCTIKVTDGFTYDGAPKEAIVEIKDEGKNKTLKINEDYSLEFTNNVNASTNTAQVKIKGINEYEGETTKTFSIGKRDLVVTPNKNQEKMVGVNDPEFTYTYGNNVNGEVAAFNGKIARAAGEDEGEYTFTIGTLSLKDNERFIANNYNLVFNNPYSYSPEAEPLPVVRPEMNEEIKFKILDFNSMVTTWNIPAGTTIKLPIPTNPKNQYRVSWGDGSYNTYTSEDFPEHTYTTAKEYTIRIAGTVKSFGYYGDEAPTASNQFKNYYTFNQYLNGIIKYGNINAERMGFSYCTKLTKPLPQLTGFEKITSLENFFNNCTGITTIANGYFKELPNVISARQTFMNCKNLAITLEDTMFADDVNIKSFEGTFKGCTKITGAIPETMFVTNRKVASFASCFDGDNKLTGELKAGLFANQNNVESFYRTFANCSQISSISETLFINCPNAINYARTFTNCTGLTSIPKDLFSVDAIVRISNDASSISDYRGTFENCTGITGEVIFNGAMVGREMFKGCTGITSVRLQRVGEIGVAGFYGNNSLTHINVSAYNLSKMNVDSFEYTGANPPLKTLINRNNELLYNYDWPADNRKIDGEGPVGTVEILEGEYTNNRLVHLKITVTDDTSRPEDCFIAIVNNTTYDEQIRGKEEKIMQSELDKITTGTAQEGVYEFTWEPFVQNKEWTIEAEDGIKTVYVFFKDEVGNISNTSMNF